MNPRTQGVILWIGKTVAKKVFPLLTYAALIVALIAFGLPAEARDKSGVLKASDLLGMNVEGIDGKKLGDIKDLVIDRGGAVSMPCSNWKISGIGDKYFAVPWEALHLDHTNKKLSLDRYTRKI